MDKYKFKATNLIAETFEKYGVTYRVIQNIGVEKLQVEFPVNSESNVVVKFISHNNDNDIAVRISGLLLKTPEEKRYRVMQACNVLNQENRFLTFVRDINGDINLKYDFLKRTPDIGVGEMAYEIFVRSKDALNDGYSLLMKALYSDEEFDILEYSMLYDLMD